jgi:nucleoid DNA-binding protein
MTSKMKKPDIAKRIARQSRVSEAEAADRLDRLIHQIVSNLRKGLDTPLPGLGKLTRGADGKPVFEREGGKRHD